MNATLNYKAFSLREKWMLMADLPINTRPPQDLNNFSASKETEIKASLNSQVATSQKIPSQVLSITANDITLSLPNQPSLKLERSKDDTLNTTLKIGDKVNISFVKDASTVVISITPEKTKPVVELEIPLSKNLQAALIKNTSLPNQEATITSHLEKNTSLALGQARRLPQEQINLKINNTTTIKSPLPGITSLPLNQTFQANLALDNNQKLMVQFTKLAESPPQTQIILPLTQLVKAIPQQQLSLLPINTVPDLTDVISSSGPVKDNPPASNNIDMTKPINQLWLRHQNSVPPVIELTNTLTKILTVSNEQIRSEINIQHNSSTTKSDNVDKSTSPQLLENKTTPVKSDSLTTLAQNTSIVKPEVELINKPIIKPIVLPELTSKADPLKTEALKAELLRTEPSNTASSNSAPSTNKAPELATQQHTKPSISPTNASVNAESLKTSIITNPVSSTHSDVKQTQDSLTVLTANDKALKASLEKILPTAVDNNPKKTPDASPDKAQSLTAEPVNRKAPELLNQTIPKSVLTSSNSAASNLSSAIPTKDSAITKLDLVNTGITKENPTSVAQIKDNDKNITQETPKDNLKQTAPINIEASKPLPSSLPLQKLNELLGALQSQSSQSAKTVKSSEVTIDINQSTNINATSSAKTEQSTPATNAELIAINQLKTLSKQITTQLPSMPQLTNPAQLSQLVEQFTRFEPLNTQNIATQATSLGPLANALQLLLGGRSAAQGQTLSPQLLKHLASIVKQPSSASNANNASNLNIALQMLGSLQSLKPLEESLANLSSNIQFYQYQNVEQQQNNQSLFYFNLPTKEPNVPQIEGEIEENNAQGEQSEKSWRLTLLLPCGDNEKIKVSALLTGSKLELDLTCNNPSLVQRADFYLGFLSNRLESLGFDKLTVSCQEGEIPATLVKRPNQLVELII